MAHTLVIAVTIEDKGTDLDALLALIEAQPNVTGAHDIAVIEHKDDARVVTVDVDVEAR